MDKLSISKGIARFSSEGWRVRVFRAAQGARLTRDIAPEMSHAGLFLPFGAEDFLPAIIDRSLPIFGLAPELPGHPLGAIFLTVSDDHLSLKELAYLRLSLFGRLPPVDELKASPELKELDRHFKQVLADMWHAPAPAQVG